MTELFTFSHIGTKKIQEDIFINFNCKDFTSNSYSCFFIFDGHGYNEKQISLVHYFLENDFFEKRFKRNFKKKEISQKSIYVFFKELDDFLLMKNVNSGACISATLISKEKIFLFNLGDCAFYLFDPIRKKCLFESISHDLDNPKEVDRINNMNMSHHIKNGRYKKLSVTRVIGDSDCKGISNEPLIPIPSVKEIKNNNDLWIFLTTDGIKMNYSLKEIINRIDDEKSLNNYLSNVATNNIGMGKDIDNFYCVLIKQRIEKRAKKICKKKIAGFHFNKIIFENLDYYVYEDMILL